MEEELKTYLSTDQYVQFRTYADENRLPRSFDVCNFWLKEIYRHKMAATPRWSTPSNSKPPPLVKLKSRSTWNKRSKKIEEERREEGKWVYVAPMFDRKRIRLPRTTPPPEKTKDDNEQLVNQENFIYDYELYL